MKPPTPLKREYAPRVPARNSVEHIIFEGLDEMVGNTGIPKAALKAAIAGGCAMKRPGNRFSLADFLRFHFDPAREDTGSTIPEGFHSWTEYHKAQQAIRESNKVRRENDELIEVTDAQKQATDAESFYFGELDRMERELPQILDGKGAIAIKTDIEKYNKQLRNNARLKFKKVGDIKK